MEILQKDIVKKGMFPTKNKCIVAEKIGLTVKKIPSAGAAKRPCQEGIYTH